MHKCDNPSCCNPKHLKGGTQAENIKDMMDKKRNKQARGEKNGWSIFTNKTVSQIKYLIKIGFTQADIYRALKCSEAAINHINTGRTWGHVKADPNP